MYNFDIDLFKNACRLFNVEVDETAVNNLNKYAGMLVEWNKVMNLTAADTPEEIAVTHFADSLSVLSCVAPEQGALLCDVGTGAGFPGVPLKIARPDIKLVLIDSLQKRVNFLNNVVTELGLKNVEVFHMRAEDASRLNKFRDAFDVVVSRAVADLPVLCEYCIPYVKPGGKFVAMKGPDVSDEVERSKNAVTVLKSEISSIDKIQLDLLRARSIISIKKLMPTPKQYPRKTAQIKKSHL